MKSVNEAYTVPGSDREEQHVSYESGNPAHPVRVAELRTSRILKKKPVSRNDDFFSGIQTVQ